MIRSLLAGFCALLCAAGTSALAAGTSSYAAQFTETRTLAGMNNPLVLHGEIRFTPGKRLLWAVNKPYRYQFEIAGGEIEETLPDGSRQSKPLAKTPWAEALFKLFSALFGGDPNALARYFEVTSNAGGLVLVPRSAALAKWVARIVTVGKPMPRTVTIEDSDGSATRLDFSTLGPTPTTAAAAATQ
ncbi:MAG: LolA family protein [Gammaproteobacteria bacterium]